MELLKDLKLTKDIHTHLEKMGLVTVDDLKKECKRQRDSIPDDAVFRSICSDCSEAELAIWINKKG